MSGYRLFTVRAEGGTPAEVSVGVEGSLAFPRYSRDGTRLAFVAEAPGGRQDLYVAASDGTTPRSILPSVDAPIGAPDWSPDGSVLIFPWRRDKDWDVYSIRDDGSGLARLTKTRGFDGGPTYSPDGSTIVFTSERGGGGGSHLFAMRPDGSGQHPLTSGEDESAADFSPDGRSIAFVGFTGGNADLWIMRADGTGRRRLTSSPMFEYDPRWSPDGRWIAFEGYTRDFPDLFLIDRNGRDRRRLTDTGKYAGNAAWRPNDKE